MATKKKAAKKAVKSARGIARPRRSVTPKGKAAKKTQRGPRSQVLPGMEQVRNRALDRICESIADERAQKNQLIQDEKDYQREAVKVMQRDKVTAYRFAGVEMVLVPGDVKLRVRTIKAQNADGAEPEDETGSGQDAGEIADALTPDDERLAENEGEGDEA